MEGNKCGDPIIVWLDDRSGTAFPVRQIIGRNNFVKDYIGFMGVLPRDAAGMATLGIKMENNVFPSATGTAVMFTQSGLQDLYLNVAQAYQRFGWPGQVGAMPF